MGLYSIIVRPFIRKMDLEKASRIGLGYFKLLGRIPFGRSIARLLRGNRRKVLPREVFGLSFCNPVGLGAGLDIHGELYNDLGNLGFSFVEVGPMGSSGIRKAIRNVQQDPQKGILAVCIDSDHHTAFTLAYDFFDFFVIDMGRDPFNTDIPDAILESRITENEYKPVILKFPETLNGSTLDSVTDYCLLNGVDGIELRDMSQVERVRSYGSGKLPIIANCHIDSPVEASRALELGASLVEIRTGLVREGPQVVSQMLQFLSENDSPEGDNSENDSSENEES